MPSRDPHPERPPQTLVQQGIAPKPGADEWWLAWVRMAKLLRICCATNGLSCQSASYRNQVGHLHWAHKRPPRLDQCKP